MSSHDDPQTILYGRADRREPEEASLILNAVRIIRETRSGTPEAEWLPRICDGPDGVPENQRIWVLQVLPFCLGQPADHHLDRAFGDGHSCHRCGAAISLGSHYVRIGEYRDEHADLCLDCGLEQDEAERIRVPDADVLRAWLRSELARVEDGIIA